MPKRIRTRNMHGLFISATAGGHATPEGEYIDTVIEATTIHTTNKVLNNMASSISYIDKERLPPLPELSNEQKHILEERGVIQTDTYVSTDSLINSNNNVTVIVEESINVIQTAISTVVEETIVVYECENDGDYYGLKKIRTNGIL